MNILDPDVRAIIKEIKRYPDPHGLASRAGVTLQTIRNWVNYRVYSPQSAKLCAVARAMGYRIKIVRNS